MLAEQSYLMYYASANGNVWFAVGLNEWIIL